MFGSLGFLQHVEAARQTQRQPEAGLFVVAKTKHVDQVGNIMLQTQDSNQVLHESPTQAPQQRTKIFQGCPKSRHMNTQDEPTVVIPRVQIQMLPQPLRESVSYIQSSLAQTVKEAEPEVMVQPQSFFKSHSEASSPSQNDQLLPALAKAPVGPECPQSPVLSRHVTIQVPEVKESSSLSQTDISRIRGPPLGLQSDKTSPQPPVMIRSEVLSKAQSMARSRLEKARFRLQGRIQQAIKFFGGKEISETEAKKKQVCLQVLRIKLTSLVKSLPLKLIKVNLK